MKMKLVYLKQKTQVIPGFVLFVAKVYFRQPSLNAWFF